MKKTGFTLSELLITLTVIGVVSALVLPAVSGILPDKNKAKVIKYNAMINNAINEILSDPNVYHPYAAVGNDGNSFNTIDGTNPCVGLACVTGGFADEMNKRFVNKVKDGSTWDIQEADEEGAYILKVVTDDKIDKQITFNKDGNNKNINTFYFNIDEYGNVNPGDALTEAFLTNYKKLNDRKADIDAAKASTTSTFYTVKTSE